MKQASTFKQVISSVCLIFCLTGVLRSQQLAFPTAEGYGKYAVGGRGGSVYGVTTLDPSGPGSLGAAIGAPGARTVVFRVSGTIEGSFNIKNDKITIAGQTAPGDGICIKGNLGISANDVIIRYIRVRANPTVETDAIGGRYRKNIILDHVSASWSSDEVMSLYHNENVTVQWCMIAEACAKGDTGHRFGGIWGNNYGTYHHNLIAHNDSRNPRWASGCGLNDYRNNVLYNWGYQSSYGAEAHQRGDRRKPPIEFSTINIVANYYKPGPATRSRVRDRIAEPSARSSDDTGSWYVADNVVEGFPAVTANNWLGVDGDNYIKLNEPWPAMAIGQQTPQDAYHAVLAHAGCSVPNRDAVDVRIIEDVRNGVATCGSNGIITTPNDAGGWPNLQDGPAPVDSDHDGMPDAWEKNRGLNPDDASDGARDRNADGYTNVEEYINGLVKSRASQAAAQGPIVLGAMRWGETVLRQKAQWYSSAEARAVADSVIQYQSPQGGWPKSTDLARPPRRPEDVPPPGRGRANSLDNDATTLPMAFLARVAHAIGEAKYEDSFLRGVDYLLAAQYPNGGWPQFWPLRKGYYSRITYNDGAMIRAMIILRDVAGGRPPYDFIGESYRKRAAGAVARGIDCILKTQIKQDGKLTAWCAQHDEKTFEPAWARSYEPPSLSGAESVGIVRFLMSVEEPNPEIVAAIESAVDWFRSVPMKGVRIESISQDDGRSDRRLVPDPDAPPLWARFYELGTNRPLYLDRDSVFRYDFSEISYERRSGYRYHGTWPASLLERDYPEWRRKHRP